MNEFYFNELVSFRFTTKELKKVSKIIKENPGLYENESHFIRCAVLTQIKKHKGTK